MNMSNNPLPIGTTSHTQLNTRRNRQQTRDFTTRANPIESSSTPISSFNLNRPQHNNDNEASIEHNEFAAHQFNTRVTMTIDEMEHLKEDLRMRLQEYKQRLLSMKEHRNKYMQENQTLKNVVKELIDERDKVDESVDAFANLRHLGQSGGDGDVVIDAEANRRRADLRQELLKGLEMIGDDDDDAVAQQGLHEKINMCTEFAELCKKFARQCDPFRKDLRFIGARYGNNVKAVFEFWKFTALSSLFYTAVWTYTIILHIIQMNARQKSFWSFSGGVLPEWTLYSGFLPTTNGGILYTSCIILSTVFSLAAAVFKTIENRKKNFLNSRLMQSKSVPKLFSSRVFNMWDFSVADAHEADDMKHSIAEGFQLLLHEEKIASQLEQRDWITWTYLCFRRFVGLLVNICVLAVSVIAIIWITVEQGDDGEIYKMLENTPLRDYTDLAGPIATSVIGAVLPILTFAITEFEQWDTQSTLIKHQMWRLYLGRMLNVCINTLSYYSIAKNPHHNKIGSTLVSGFGSDFNHAFACGADAAGSGLFLLVMSEFFIGKIIKLLSFAAKNLFRRFIWSGLAQTEYSVSQAIIEMLYFQSLVWISLPLYPIGSVFCAFLLFLNFKFERFQLTKLRKRATQKSSDKNMGAFVTYFYNTSLAFTIASYLFFLTNSWPCGEHADKGAFALAPAYTPIIALNLYLDEAGFSLIFLILTNIPLYIGFLIVIFVLWRIRCNHLKALEMMLEQTNFLHGKQIASMQIEIQKKERVILAQKRVNRLV